MGCPRGPLAARASGLQLNKSPSQSRPGLLERPDGFHGAAWRPFWLIRGIVQLLVLIPSVGFCAVSTTSYMPYHILLSSAFSIALYFLRRPLLHFVDFSAVVAVSSRVVGLVFTGTTTLLCSAPNVRSYVCRVLLVATRRLLFRSIDDASASSTAPDYCKAHNRLVSLIRCYASCMSCADNQAETSPGNVRAARCRRPSHHEGIGF